MHARHNEPVFLGVLEEKNAAARAVAIARRDVLAATILLDALEADGTPPHDAVLIGTRLRLLMAQTVKWQAEAWLRIAQARGA